MSSAADPTSGLLRHERLIVAVLLIALIVLAWWFLLSGGGMTTESAMAGMDQPPFPAVLAMWWVMMAAMMLPSAAPAVMLYGRVRRIRSDDDAIAPSSVFLAGYLALWLAFSLFAAAAQLLLTGASMVLNSTPAEAALLIAAGIYQLSPFKAACLAECRSPAQFISRHWRPGMAGALRLGVLHGAFCVGCCWVLMLLLFVGGIMNLVWIVGLTAIVAAEKLLPHGLWLGRLVGLVLVGWGVVRLAG